MFLQHVSVKGFRNLSDFELHLQPGLNAIVGGNNVGKTNVLLAIQHALGPAAAYGETLWLTEDDLFRENNGTRADSIQITLAFSDLSPDELTQLYEIVDFEARPKAVARICYEAVWQEHRRRFRVARWGRSEEGERTAVPDEILDAISIVFLPALRDAEAALRPGYRSRLARLLEEHAKRNAPDEREQIVGIFTDANAAFRESGFVTDVENRLRSTAAAMAGDDYATPSIQAAPVDFARVLRSLHVTVDDNPVPDISACGLGYSNLLYIATVLAHLRAPEPGEYPMLFVEEPEAHLHPQSLILLAEHLASMLAGKAYPQTIITTHSPVLASHLRPSQVAVIYQDFARGKAAAHLASASLSRAEERQLQRMLDVTRATLYFGKALILVEGITEALLLPVLAKLIGVDLARSHVSVVPIAGVSFSTFKKLLLPDMFGIRTAILTDGDPKVVGRTWRDVAPKRDENSVIVPSKRARSVVEGFANHENVRVCRSEVTLEYDLAAAAHRNVEIMVETWSALDRRFAATLKRERDSDPNSVTGPLWMWRLMRGPFVRRKAEFAHQLAERLSDPSAGAGFVVPKYIHDAITHVVAQGV